MAILERSTPAVGPSRLYTWGLRPGWAELHWLRPPEIRGNTGTGAGRDGEHWSAASNAVSSRKCQYGRDCAADERIPGYRSAHHDDGVAGCGGIRFTDRVREYREPAPGPRRIATEGTRSATGARCKWVANWTTSAHRKCAVVPIGWNVRCFARHAVHGHSADDSSSPLHPTSSA